jgi:methyltransferase
MIRAAIVVLVAFVPMIAEAQRSKRNERKLRALGAIEPPADVYRVMQIAYPACFVAIAGEALLRDATLGPSFTAGTMVFAAAKALKYWAIVTLGERWTFRVLVLPGQPLVTAGPYRLMRHPNYLGVAGELVGAALMAHAPLAGGASLLGFGSPMLGRIRGEKRALGGR